MPGTSQAVHKPGTCQASPSVAMPGEQRKRTYRLTDEAVAGLDRLATRHHTTVTALVEALGVLARHRDPAIAEVVERARAIDRERRSRR